MQNIFLLFFTCLTCHEQFWFVEDIEADPNFTRKNDDRKTNPITFVYNRNEVERWVKKRELYNQRKMNENRNLNDFFSNINDIEVNINDSDMSMKKDNIVMIQDDNNNQLLGNIRN